MDGKRVLEEIQGDWRKFGLDRLDGHHRDRGLGW